MTSKTWIIIGIVIVALGLGVYFITSGSDDELNEEQPVPVAQTEPVAQQEPVPVEEEEQDQPPVNEEPANVVVKYSDGGFSPAEVTVKQGETVNFINNTEIPLWVASDNHPTHTIYPEFDAARVIGGTPAPGDDFSFTFSLVGTWTYHNHSAPSHVGTIIVE